VVAAKERKELKSSRKTENGLERVDKEGGRYMLNRDSLAYRPRPRPSPLCESSSLSLVTQRGVFDDSVVYSPAGGLEVGEVGLTLVNARTLMSVTY